MGDYCTKYLVRTPQRTHSVSITRAAGEGRIRKQLLFAVTNYTIQIQCKKLCWVFTVKFDGTYGYQEVLKGKA